MNIPWRKLEPFIAEMIVSFGFGFVVYSAILTVTIADVPSGAILIGVAIGFSSVAYIYSFNEITIAHYNPAITLAAILYCKLPVIRGFVFIIAQLLGFMIAASAVLGCFPGKVSFLLETIRPKPVSDDVTTGELIALELFLTGILVFVAFMVGINPYKKPDYLDAIEYETDAEKKANQRPFAPLAVGLTLGFLGLLGAATSGGVFNPGLVWAPVLFTGRWGDSWKYWVGQFAGGIAAGFIQVFILNRN